MITDSPIYKEVFEPFVQEHNEYYEKGLESFNDSVKTNSFSYAVSWKMEYVLGLDVKRQFILQAVDIASRWDKSFEEFVSRMLEYCTDKLLTGNVGSFYQNRYHEAIAYRALQELRQSLEMLVLKIELYKKRLRRDEIKESEKYLEGLMDVDATDIKRVFNIRKPEKITALLDDFCKQWLSDLESDFEGSNISKTWLEFQQTHLTNS